ncbi:hypothetical protein Angca_006206, partial [Angiostrongylus cantonensis]
MRIITVTRKDGQSLGILIHGGVGKPAANPADERDEGIFVEKIEPSSVCHQAGLQVGHRLIEVNGDSLLGCDQSEAAAILRSSNELRILVCDGYNLANVPRTDDRDTASSRSSSNMMLADENKLTSTTSVASAVINNPVRNGEHCLELPRCDEPPLASSSPLPANPLLLPTSAPLQNVPFIPEITQPEKLTFASKVRNFEREIEVQRLGTKQGPASSLPSAMKPLVAENDINKGKDEDSRKNASLSEAVGPEKVCDRFEGMVENSAKSRIISNLKKPDISVPSNLMSSCETPLNDVEKRAMEQQRRSEWRAARLKSLDQERAEADAIMDRLQLISLPAIGEDGSVPPSERILSNDISIERSTVVDAVTGERKVIVVEKSVTKRE